MLRDGFGGPKDPQRGYELPQAVVAAHPTHGYSHFQLGIAYARGIGVPADKLLARESYRKTLAHGEEQARVWLNELGFSE